MVRTMKARYGLLSSPEKHAMTAILTALATAATAYYSGVLPGTSPRDVGTRISVVETKVDDIQKDVTFIKTNLFSTHRR